MDAFGVPYTGSNVLGSALSMDKIRTKQVWLSLGLPTPQYRKVTAEDVHANAAELGLPVVVKPANEGSSVGISRVTDEAGLDEAVALAARYDGQLLMEQMVVGDELTVAILGDVALPSIRIVPKGQWYDYNAKYIAEDTQYLCPGLDGADEDEIRRIALAAFRAAGCRGWGRVDVMRDRASGRFFLLEVNTAPGMTSHSLVPKAAAQAGIGFEELVWRVLEQTLEAPHACTRCCASSSGCWRSGAGRTAAAGAAAVCPCRFLRGQAAGRAGRPGKTAVGGKRAGAQAVAGRAGSDPGRAQAVRALGQRPPGLRAGQVVPHAEEAGRPGAARTGRPGQPDRRSDEAVQRLACIVRTGRRRCAPGDDGCAWQLVAGAEQRHRSGGRP
ncbi:hypothetical protein G6F31_014113 [Rhizopus arrhizus]|nr:hypothetical protein G6F31_014113 [Rhizopus arrhizus]